ncbi:MAG: hypothetical protein WEE89_13405 [Gemmatimonadota bacterium]
MVFVFDANYAGLLLEHERGAGNTRKVSFGVTGAAGVFAASAAARLPVVVRRMP